MTRHCLALDLKDDDALIKQYDEYHKQVWPEIKKSILQSGIEQMSIYRTGNRLFMIMEVGDDFSFAKKTEADAANPKVVEWEDLMWNYQQAIPTAKRGEKWVPMKKIFEL